MTTLTRVATAGELADFYAEKMEDAQLQVSAMYQTLSQARRDFDGCSDVMLGDYMRSLIAVEDELEKMTKLYRWYSSFPRDAVGTPF